MTEMIERVARAINPQAFVAFDKHGRDTMARQQALSEAKRAIAAMREPTHEMLSAGDSKMPQIAKGEDITTGFDALAEAWPAMIDEALSSCRSDGDLDG